MIPISVIIPIYNEEKTVLNILKKINQLKSKIKLEIIVVNDGSDDNSKKIIDENENYYDQIKHFSNNSGKGKAIIEGLKLAKNKYVFFQDADLEYYPEDLNKFVKIIEEHNADLIMGSRFTSERRTVLNFWHMMGNKFITLLFNMLNNTTFTDIYCCYCLFNKENLPISKLKSMGWGQQAEILTYLAKNSDLIFETAVNYNGRKYAEGKKIRYYHVIEVIYWIAITKLKTLIK